MSSRFGHAGHVFRMAALFAAGVAVFLAAREAFVPDDFGVLGHYRATALDLNRARPLAHAGRVACTTCHADVVAKRAGQRHEQMGCEGCHGPSAAHARGEAGAPKPARPKGQSACLGCHEQDASRPAAQPQVSVKEHAGDAPCVSCHDPHAPRMS